MIISKVSYGDKSVELCGAGHDVESNVYTLLVGRNGCGKSTLLKKICLLNLASVFSRQDGYLDVSSLSRYLSGGSDSSLNSAGSMTICAGDDVSTITVLPYLELISEVPVFNRVSYSSTARATVPVSGAEVRHTKSVGDVSALKANPKLIAVSSSPFDKFPLVDNFPGFDFAEKYYIYRGAKSSGRNSQGNYLAAKFDQLGGSFINLFLINEKRKEEILPLFSYLGITSKLKLILKGGSHFSFDDFLNEDGRGPADAIRTNRFFKSLPMRHDDEIAEEVCDRIIKSVRSIYEVMYKKGNINSRNNFIYELNLDISSDDVVELLPEFAVLAEYDLIDLEDIEFTKKNNGSCFLLTEASSGELCILFNILSVAGAISDDSVILLDEPELSLHPEWQCDFLPLLERIFSNYKRCHFIVATHSPQIVSSVSASNSYVVNLEDNPAAVIEGRLVSEQSSDYQLAYIFRSPGHRNEYLITQIVEVLSKIRDGEQVSEAFFAEIESLIKFHDLVPEDDPVKKLLSTLEKALRVIRND